MKHFKRLGILTLLAAVVISALTSCAPETRNLPPNPYELGVPYAVIWSLYDTIGAKSIKSETDTFQSIYSFKDPNAQKDRTVEFDGETYEVEYSASEHTIYRTQVDLYHCKSADDFAFFCLLSPEDGSLISATLRRDEFKKVRDSEYDQPDDYYIKLARKALKGSLNLRGYETRVVHQKDYFGNVLRVYFEKHLGGYLLTQAYVDMLPDGRLCQISTERDFDTSGISDTNIHKDDFVRLRDEKIKALCEQYRVVCEGYVPDEGRIVRDLAGYPAVVYLVETSDADDTRGFLDPFFVLFFI